MPLSMDTYIGSSEMRESLFSILRDISPNEDNYLISNLPKAPVATNSYTEWNTFYDARPTSVTPKGEGADTAYATVTAEARTGNYTAILEEPVKVSRTMASIATVTGEDEVSKQKERALKRLKAQMEYYTINASGPSAGLSGGVARGAAGILGCISTNVTARASNTSFSPVEFNDMVEESWTGVNGEYVANVLLCPVVLKRRVATFGTNLTRNINASEKRLTNEVRVYDSDVGPTVMIIAHKDIANVGASGLQTQAVLINDQCFGLSFLVDSGEPHYEDRAKSGDFVAGTYITEMTVASFAQRASVKRSYYSKSL